MPAEGLQMGDENALRIRAREAMKAGNLPDCRPKRIWGGPGVGASCALCGRIVGKEELEFELQFTSDGDPSTSNYHVHVLCFTAWELERRSGCSNGYSLPQRGNGCIMPSREFNTTNQGERD